MIYGPTDPMGKMFFSIPATFAELEVDLLRMCTREEWSSTTLPCSPNALPPHSALASNP